MDSLGPQADLAYAGRNPPMPTGHQSGTIRVIIVHDDQHESHRARVALEAALGGAFARVSVGTFETPGDALASLPGEGSRVVCVVQARSPEAASGWLATLEDARAGPVIVITTAAEPGLTASTPAEGTVEHMDRSVLFGDGAQLRWVVLDALRRFELERTADELAAQLKTVQQELRLKCDVLATMSDSAHRFVEDVAHEFRTPLAVIQEFASIMADGIGGEVSEKHVEFLDYIANATRDLSLLVDDFLDSSKLRTGTLRVDRRSYAVGDVLDACWPLLEARARARGIALERSCDPDAPRVFLDLDKAKRALSNLVVSALKVSTPDSRVLVRAGAIDADAVRFQVCDQGPTMSTPQLQRLRRHFATGGAHASADSGEIGLGLSLVSELARVNLGSASIDRCTLGGNCFSFTAPIDRLSSVVDHYLAWISTVGEASMLSFLRVHEPSAGVSQGALESFLGSVSRSTDLKLPSPDGDGFIVVGVGYRPHEWRTRVRAWYAESALPAAAPNEGGLWVEVLGTRSVREARAFLIKQLVPCVEV
jgi:signal transduction histidine kinase